MQIDWLTVAAQIVNFLILVWLLKRLLYRPVLSAMARREKGIAERIDEAARRGEEAANRAREYREKAEALERAREATIAEARSEAAQERRRLLDAARREVDEQRQKWRADLQREAESFRQALKRELATAVVRVSRRALADLADATLERQAVATFLRRLEHLPEAEREPFVRASQPLRLASSFELDDTVRERLRTVLGVSTDIEYVRDPELVCGVVLTGAGHKLEWNVADYLGDLVQRVDELLAAPVARRAHG